MLISVQYFNYNINNTELERLSVIKDLGVYFHSSFSFSDHIITKVREALKFYGFIVRNCASFTDSNAFLILYSAYIRSKLEYASLIWYPLYTCYRQLIERVQRRFLKFVSYKVSGVYPERGIPYINLISTFQLQTLDLRRKCASIVFLYKLLHNAIDSSELVAHIDYLVPSISTRSHRTFYCARARTNLLLKSPVCVMCSNYNVISDKCDIFFDNLSHIIALANNMLHSGVI